MRERQKIEQTNKISLVCDYCGGPLEILYWNDREKAFLIKCKICKRTKWWKTKGDNNAEKEERGN